MDAFQTKSNLDQYNPTIHAKNANREIFRPDTTKWFDSDYVKSDDIVYYGTNRRRLKKCFKVGGWYTPIDAWGDINSYMDCEGMTEQDNHEDIH